MYKFNIRKQIAVLLSVVLIVSVSLPTAFAFITNTTPSVKNTFIPEAHVEPERPNDIVVDIVVDKTVRNIGEESISAEGFEFVLDGADGSVQRKMTDDGGDVQYRLTFTADDVNRTFTYSLYETNDGREHVTYDDAVHSISITITHDRSTNLLVATKLLDGVKIDNIVVDFENVYDYTKQDDDIIIEDETPLGPNPPEGEEPDDNTHGGGIIIEDETPLAPVPPTILPDADDKPSPLPVKPAVPNKKPSGSISGNMIEIFDETPLGSAVNTADPTCMWRWAISMCGSGVVAVYLRKSSRKLEDDSIG